MPIFIAAIGMSLRLNSASAPSYCYRLRYFNCANPSPFVAILNDKSHRGSETSSESTPAEVSL